MSLAPRGGPPRAGGGARPIQLRDSAWEVDLDVEESAIRQRLREGYGTSGPGAALRLQQAKRDVWQLLRLVRRMRIASAARGTPATEPTTPGGPR